MESSETDKGISDVLALTLTLDSPGRKDRDKRESNLEPSHENSHASNSVSENRDDNDDEAIAIDLSDPEKVIKLLETVDLSEEDTEVLLQEAYAMNKKLKEMLRRQEQGSDSPNKSVKQKSKDSHPKSSSASASGSRNGSAFGQRNPLPPITKESSIYAVKLRRSRTTVQDMSPPKDYTIQRSKTKDTIGGSKKPLARSKTTEPRPDWNDRFNFS